MAAWIFRAVMALVFVCAVLPGGASVSWASELAPPAAVLHPADVPPTPEDGGPRVRHSLGLQMGYIQPEYLDARLDYQYQAWLGRRWGLVAFTRLNLAGVSNWLEDTSPWLELGPQYTIAGDLGGHFSQSLRVGVWFEGFPPEISPSLTYAVEAMALDKFHKNLAEFNASVSIRPLARDGFVHTEGNAALWWHPVGFGGMWEVGRLDETFAEAGPRVDVQIKKLRVYGGFLFPEAHFVLGARAAF